MFTLLEAAEAVGVSKSTLRRAVKEGKVSATRNEAGAFLIDPAELHRVFPPASPARAVDPLLERHDTPVLSQLVRLEAELNAALSRCRDLETDRDRWHAQAERLALPAPAQPGLFARLFRRAA